MKRNGWGLRAELLFVLMFLICLVVAAIGLNKIGLIGGNIDPMGSAYNKENTEETYEILEGRLVSATKRYINGKYGGNNVQDTLTVRLSTLYYNDYTTKLYDNSNNECSGYVIVKNMDSILTYSPYLRCKGYKTSGYESSKDW